MPGRFEANVRACEVLGVHYRPGLQALRPRDARRIRVKHPRRLTGSLYLDSAFRGTLPEEPLWDYGIGYRHSGHEEESVHWVEVHPANDGEVAAVEAKLDWLKKWLRVSAPGVAAMRSRFVWISSGNTSLTPMAPGLRRLAEKGLRHVGGVYAIDA